MPLPRLAVPLVLGALVLSGCAAEEDPAAAPAASSSASGDCTPESLETTADGVFTIGTDSPAYEPWFVDDDPTNGRGYESAVAYAVAEELGYSREQVEWTVAAFNTVIAPGPKPFDVAINQVSITDERRSAVDFSSGYYDVQQALITVEGSPAAGVTSLEELEGLRLGGQVGTTSLRVLEEVVQPSTTPAGFDTNDVAKAALANGSVDAIAVDLPTAFFITAAELEGGAVVGQLPELPGAASEQFGFVLELGSPLTDCVSQAVDALREDGTLDALEAEWLADVAGAPVLE